MGAIDLCAGFAAQKLLIRLLGIRSLRSRNRDPDGKRYGQRNY